MAGERADVGRIGLLVRQPEIADWIVEKIVNGATLEVAADSCGIVPRVLTRWLKRGREATDAVKQDLGLSPDDDIDPADAPERERPYVRLVQAVEVARAKAEVTALALLWDIARGGQILERRVIPRRDGSVEEVTRYAPPDAKPLMFLLERGRPERWARTSQRVIVLSGPDGGPIPLDGADNRIADALEALLRGPEALPSAG